MQSHRSPPVSSVCQPLLQVSSLNLTTKRGYKLSSAEMRSKHNLMNAETLRRVSAVCISQQTVNGEWNDTAKMAWKSITSFLSMTCIYFTTIKNLSLRMLGS